MWKGEVSDKSAGGEIVWREATIFPVKDEQGQLLYSVYMSENITERKNTENLLKIQRDLSLAFAQAVDINEVLELLLDATFQMPGIDAGGVYLRDTKTGALDLIVHKGLSKQFLAVTSHYDGDSPQAQLVAKGNPIHQQFLKLGIELDKNHKKETIKAISVIPIKYKGEVIADLNLASHTHNELPASTRHTIEAIGGMVGELIIRIRVELALRESEERYRRLIDMFPDAILIIQDGKCRYINKAFTKIFGYNNQDIEEGLDFIKLMQEKDRKEAILLYQSRIGDKNFVIHSS